MLMVDCTKNLYEILNVSFGATPDEIKLAYKKLVRIYHPDINKSPDAEIKFKLLNNAYDVLSDNSKRKNYDSLLNITKGKNNNVILRKESKQQNQNFKEEAEFKKESQTVDKDSVIKEVKITETEAAYGTTRIVNILNTQKCPKCMGKKFLNGIKCAFCLGEGEKKELKKIEVEIKKGVLNNELIFVGKVNSSALYDKKLFLKILIEPPKKLYFEGNDVIVRLEIPFYDAVLGTEREINIQNISIQKVVIPPLTSFSSRIKLDVEEENINYYADVKIIFPNEISSEEKKLYEKLKMLDNKRNQFSSRE